jgi:hypothetical protein
MEATATDIDGAITNVEFLINSTVVTNFTDTNQPYLAVFTNDLTGPFTFQARAYDDKGAVQSTALQTIVFGGKGGTNSLNPYSYPTNLIKFCMEGEPGRNYEVEATTSLTNPVSWTFVTNLSLMDGKWQIYLPDLTNYNYRYYRAVRLPRGGP